MYCEPSMISSDSNTFISCLRFDSSDSRYFKSLVAHQSDRSGLRSDLHATYELTRFMPDNGHDSLKRCLLEVLSPLRTGENTGDTGLDSGETGHVTPDIGRVIPDSGHIFNT